MKCPHCSTRSTIRSSEQISPLLQRSYCRCKNLLCGHTFTVLSQVSETLVQSAMPNPNIQIPISSRKQLEALMQSQQKPL